MSKLLSMMMSSSGGGGDETKYIYATDNAYIDTGISSGFSKVVIKGKVRNVTISNFTRFFGATNPSSYKGTYGYINTGTNELGLNYYKTNSSSASAGTCSYTVDEDFVLEGNYSIMGTPTGTIKILACVESSYSTSYYYSNEAIGISSIEFYDGNDNLLYQFKPATQNNVDGMIETVHNQFFANANSVGTLHIEGGTSQGTLNAEIVGTPTISDDFILSNFDNSNYLKFVPTTSNLTDFTFTTKFKVSDLTTERHIFQCVPDQSGLNFGYATDGSGTNGLSVLVTDHSNTSYWGNAINGTTGYRISNAYTVANQWMWIKIEVTNGQDIKVYSSTDGTTYTKIHDVTAIYGTGNFGQLQYEIIGGNETISTGIEIDLKEVKMYVDGTLFWEAVSF